MATWNLIYNGVAGGSLEAWGVSQLRLSRASQGMDVLTFVADGKLFDSDQDFAFGGTIEIMLGGATWFVGTITRVPRRASGPTESLEYTVSGPWYWLDQTIFKLVWQYRNGSVNVAVPLASSHLLLNVSNGVWVHTGTMITGAVNYAISRGAPIQVGVVSPALFPPIDEVRDITCGEVIRKMMRWHPRAVTWFDYSTKPYPTFHCRNAEELTQAPLSLPPDVTGTNPVSYEINALYEQQRPSVCINYERTNTINDEQFVKLVQDIAPVGANGSEIKCLTVTVDLQGTKENVVSADIVCNPVPDAGSDAEKLAWLIAHCPELQNPRISGLTLVGFARRVGSHGYPRELADGQVADWMNFTVEEDVMFADVTFSYKGLDGTITSSGVRSYHPKFKATDGITGTYQNTVVTDEADPLPIGVAQYLYDQVKDLQYGGSFTLESQELSVPPRPGIGNTVRLLGARPEWAVMVALVQQTSEELDSGRLTVAFGPPGHLGPSDLIELTKINRYRRRDTPSSAMTSGRSAMNDVKLGEKMPNNESGHNDADLQYRLVRAGSVAIVLDGNGGVLSITDNAAPGPRGVSMPTAACKTPAGAPLMLSPQEVPVCSTNAQGQPVTRYRMFLVSPEYDH